MTSRALTTSPYMLDFSKMEAEKLKLESRPFVIEYSIDCSFEMQSIKANRKHLFLARPGHSFPDDLLIVYLCTRILLLGLATRCLFS